MCVCDPLPDSRHRETEGKNARLERWIGVGLSGCLAGGPALSRTEEGLEADLSIDTASGDTEKRQGRLQGSNARTPTPKPPRRDLRARRPAGGRAGLVGWRNASWPRRWDRTAREPTQVLPQHNTRGKRQCFSLHLPACASPGSACATRGRLREACGSATRNRWRSARPAASPQCQLPFRPRCPASVPLSHSRKPVAMRIV